MAGNLPMEHAYEAMMAMEKITWKITPHLFISQEIRTIRRDNLDEPLLQKKIGIDTAYYVGKLMLIMNLLPLVGNGNGFANTRPPIGQSWFHNTSASLQSQLRNWQI